LKSEIQKLAPSLQAPKGKLPGGAATKPLGERSAAFQRERVPELEKFLTRM